MVGLYDRRFSYLLRVELERQESSLWDALGQIDIRRRGGIRDISRTVFGGTVLRTLVNNHHQIKDLEVALSLYSRRTLTFNAFRLLTQVYSCDAANIERGVKVSKNMQIAVFTKD